MKKQCHILKFVYFILLIIFTEISYADTLVYRNTISGKETGYEIIIKEADIGYIINTKSSHDKESNLFYTDKSYFLLNWKYLNPEDRTDFFAERKENEIFLKGIFNNKEINKKIKIDDLPWSQDWGLVQKQFIISDNDIFYFITIDPSNLRKFKFECRKIKNEKIKINGHDTETVHVKVGLTGIMKKFWDGGDIWFRKSDGTHVFSEKLNYENPEDCSKLISEEK